MVYSGYGIAFDGKGEWSFGNDSAKNVIIFGVDNKSSSHTNNLKNDFLILVEGPTFGINGSFGASEKNLTLILVKQRQNFVWVLFYYKLDRCVGSCHTLNGLFNKVCIPNKTEDLNLSVFNMITVINETLTTHISCECKCKLYETKCKSNQWWSNDKCPCEC